MTARQYSLIAVCHGDALLPRERGAGSSSMDPPAEVCALSALFRFAAASV
jgi:hypothetical protein